jgi:hypothetical protein
VRRPRLDGKHVRAVGCAADRFAVASRRLIGLGRPVQSQQQALARLAVTGVVEAGGQVVQRRGQALGLRRGEADVTQHQQGAPMDSNDIAGVTDQVARLVDAHYVFPDVGARIARLLATRSADGRYARIADPAALAALVTEDLQSVNGDKHLRLLHSIDEIPDGDDEAEQIAALTREAALACGGVARVERLLGNVGNLDLRPLLFPPSMAGGAMVAAMNLVATTDVLIIDARGCRGGDPAMLALLCSYLFDEPVHLDTLVERAGGRSTQTWTLPYVPGPRFGGTRPVYVLTAGATFSGGEALAYDLQQHGRATVVGERTGGGAHPRRAFRVHPHLQATVPVARAVHPVSGTNWEGTGVTPDVEVPAADAFRTAYARALDHVIGLGDGDGRRQTAEEARRARDDLRRPDAVPV